MTLMKIVNMTENIFKTFEVFRKDVTYDNIKSHSKEPGVHPISRRHIFGKTAGEGQM